MSREEEAEPPGAPGNAAAAARERRICDRLAAAILALMVALLLHGAWRVGPTYDEHFYVASGVAYLHDGEFSLNREHPPLSKLLAGLPLVLAPGVDFPEHWADLVDYPVTFFYERNAAHLDRNLFLARLLPSLLTACMAFAVYRAGRRLFSPRAGLVSLVLIAFNPNVLAHGRLAALDMGVSVFMFLAALSFAELLRAPTPVRRLEAALMFGLANLCKFTALVLVPFFALVALVQAARERRLRPLGALATTLLGGLGVFAAGYGFEAKSINQAFGDGRYHVTDGIPKTVVLQAVTRAGMPAERLHELRPMGDRGAWIRRLAQLASAEGPQREPALIGLRELARGPVEDRRLAFSLLLPGIDVVPGDGLSLAVLSDLADVRLASIEEARTFFAEHGQDPWNPAIFTQGWIEALTRGLLGDRRPIPLLTAFKGIDYQLHHGKQGHASYFRGEVLRDRDFAQGNPHPEYYAWVFGIKNPLAFLALVALGLLLSVRPRREWDLPRFLVLVGLPVLLFVVFSNGRALLGVKYLLPAFPFLALLAGRAAQSLPRLAPLLALVAVLESAWIHPHELMYYNLPAGGPSGGPEISVVGDDWGQDVRELGRFYRAHRAEILAAGGLHYAPYSRGDMAAFGLDEARPIAGRTRGIVAVNVVNYFRERQTYAWLDEFTPFHVIGWSIRLYDTRPGPPGGDPLAE